MRIALLPAAIGIPLLAFAAFSLAFSGSTRAQETVTIAVGDIWFCELGFANATCPTTVNAGDTVVWTNQGALPHTVTSAAFDSGIINAGGSFQFTFTEPGTYAYDCTVHPGQMAGQVTVAAVEAPPPAEPTPTPAPGVPTPTPAPTPAVPPVTGGPDAPGSSVSWVAVLALAAGAVMLLTSAGLAARTIRNR